VKRNIAESNNARSSLAKVTIRMLLAVATPMHMMAPIREGTLSVVPVTNNIHKYLAVPVSSSTGTSTMQIARVETKVGMAICAAPSMTARTSGFRMPM